MITSPTFLVVMAAGLGSRFGGIKQLEPVGPNGEVILDYTIRDGLAAGLDTVVLIVRSDIRAEVDEHLRAVHGDDHEIVLVDQDALPPPREKPWGTVHATLSAAGVVDGPFVLVNADDYYGSRSFELAAAEIDNVDGSTASIVAFELGKTLPASGSVTRGVCRTDGDGNLEAIVETDGLQRRADGTVGIGPDGPEIDPATAVSMNLWVFDRSILDAFAERFEIFVADHRDDPGAECLLPTEVSRLMGEGVLDVRVRSSPETWTGITNPGDVETVRSLIAAIR